MSEQKIIKLSERMHILTRPSMYIGQVVRGTHTEWILENNKIIQKDVSYVPGLLKIINEIIDNSIDEYVKTDGMFANNIEIKITSNEVIIEDNGRGIPVKKGADDIYLPTLCFMHARAGSNFVDTENKAQIGTNGVGSFATVCFSKKFIAETDDGKNAFKLVSTNNAEKFTEKLLPSKGNKSLGTKVTFIPDFERFQESSLDDISINLLYTRVLNLSLTYPGISFKFNNKKIQSKNIKDFLKYFGSSFEFFSNPDCTFAVFPNTEDDFRQFSYINGLRLPEGGTHITQSLEHITKRIQSVLIKKYKTIKPGDIKNKLLIVCIGKNFKNLRFNSQTKECITNSGKEVTEWMGVVEWDNFVNKLLKNKNIIDPITEVYKIKEELKKRMELKSLETTKEKIKSDKYTKAVGKNKILFITEGASACNGLMPSLGRNGIAYYELKGKVLNVIGMNASKFSTNVELKELYKIIKNEGFEKIGIATDADLDGYNIASLLMAFIKTYLPDEFNKVYLLNTPIAASYKNKKIDKWVYNFDEIHNLKGETKYFKGYGSWTPVALKYVISIDGLDNMLVPIGYDPKRDDECILDWFDPQRTNRRKEMIKQNDFNLIKI